MLNVLFCKKVCMNGDRMTKKRFNTLHKYNLPFNVTRADNPLADKELLKSARKLGWFGRCGFVKSLNDAVNNARYEMKK